MIGPYIDTDRTGNRLMAISLPLLSDGGLVGAVCFELLTTSIDEFVNGIIEIFVDLKKKFTDVTFLNTGEALIINKDYTVLSAPESWGLSSSEILTVDSASVKKFISILRKDIWSRLTS